MATLKEYFVKDGRSTMTLQTEMEVDDGSGNQLMTLTGRIHLHFEASATYVSFYIPKRRGVDSPELLCLNSLDKILDLQKNCEVQQIDGGTPNVNSVDFSFTGRIFFYLEDEISDELKAEILRQAKENGHTVIFRGQGYMDHKRKFESPLAFISHDWRDKKEIAEPLAIELSKRLCPVWYDEFTLKVGDSLRESIEKGLKECRKCVFVITPNFLENGGWSKREYQSIFTRELVEEQRLILPIWSRVTPKDVFEYSPILADRVAIKWDEGAEVVAAKLVTALGSM